MMARRESGRMKGRVTHVYLLLFYALAAYRWFGGLWMYQLQPFLFKTRQDIFTWVFMQTRIHLWLVGPSAFWHWVLFDGLFYTAPLVYYMVARWAESRDVGSVSHTWVGDRVTVGSGLISAQRGAITGAVYLLLVQWTYIQCYTLFGVSSIEGFVGYMLFPILFLTSKESTFDYLWEGLRYFFLFFFASAGLWKIVQGGVFNGNQMSAILRNQHLDLMTIHAGGAYENFIGWLVIHPVISYELYLCATLAELSFLVGFFTRKWDRVLGLIFIVFLILDKFLMGIDYMDSLLLALTLFIPGRRLRKDP